MLRLAMFASLIVSLGAGCASDKNRGASASAVVIDRQSLGPIPQPDLSRVAASVQAQVADRHASLTRKLEDPRTSNADLAAAYGELGKIFMAGEYFDAAESCFLNAQGLMPEEMRWPYYLGHVYRKRGEPAKAVPFFEQTVKLRPDDVPALVWLGTMHLDEGRPNAAEPVLAKATSLQPRSAAALFGLGRAALSRKDYTQAVRYLEEALAVDPAASVVRYPLATAYRALGQPDRAEAHLRQRGSVDIASPDPLIEEVDGLLETALAYEFRGLRAFDQGQWAEAAAYFRKGVGLEPDNASVRHKLGTALYLSGDARGAEEQFREVVRRSPDFSKARYSLGVLMESMGRRKEAIDELLAAVKYEPTYIEAQLALAEIFLRSAHLTEALSRYEQLIKIDPRVPDARFGYAMALVQMKRYQEARDRLSEGMQAYPNQPGFAHALARLQAAAPDDRVRDGRHAMALVQQLLKSHQSLELGETMAMTLAELGQYKDAVSLQRQVMADARQSGREDLVRGMTQNLRSYESGQPCRVPWRALPDLKSMLAPL